ncbi:MAG TPA: hypothetical protein VF870_09315 [Ignavibacteriaceae bacterium]
MNINRVLDFQSNAGTVNRKMLAMIIKLELGYNFKVQRLKK